MIDTQTLIQLAVRAGSKLLNKWVLKITGDPLKDLGLMIRAGALGYEYHRRMFSEPQGHSDWLAELCDTKGVSLNWLLHGKPRVGELMVSGVPGEVRRLWLATNLNVLERLIYTDEYSLYDVALVWWKMLDVEYENAAVKSDTLVIMTDALNATVAFLFDDESNPARLPSIYFDMTVTELGIDPNELVPELDEFDSDDAQTIPHDYSEDEQQVAATDSDSTDEIELEFADEEDRREFWSGRYTERCGPRCCK